MFFTSKRIRQIALILNFTSHLQIVFFVCERILQLANRHEALSIGLKTVSSPSGPLRVPTNILYQLTLHEPFTHLFFSSSTNLESLTSTSCSRASYNSAQSQSELSRLWQIVFNNHLFFRFRFLCIFLECSINSYNSLTRFKF